MTKKLRKEKQRQHSMTVQKEREFENRMCGDKKGFNSDIEAWNAGKFGLKGRYFRTYLCPICGKWHITTQMKSGWKRYG